MMTAWLAMIVWIADPNAAEVSIPNVVVTLIDHVEVPAQEQGVMIRKLANEGQMVQAGQLLGVQDDRDVKLLRVRAETELAIAQRASDNELKVRFAQKAAEVARSELKRSLDSVEKFPKSVSQTELDRLQLLADKSVLEMEQALEELAAAKLQQSVKQNEVERARLQEERRRIVAPIAGVVVQWKRNQGEWLEPGEAVVRIIQLQKLRAEGFAPADQLTPDSIGRGVTLTVERPGQPAEKFTGKLVFISPEIDPVNKQVRFWAEVENSQSKLRPGQTGALAIHPRDK